MKVREYIDTLLNTEKEYADIERLTYGTILNAILAGSEDQRRWAVSRLEGIFKVHRQVLILRKAMEKSACESETVFLAKESCKRLGIINKDLK